MYSIKIGLIYFESDDEWKKCIELHPNDGNIVEVNFEHLFPHMKVHAKLIDEFHSSRIFPFCSSVKHD